MKNGKLKPQTLLIGNLYEIEQGGVKEKYLVMEHSGRVLGNAIETTLKPVMKGRSDIVIRLLGKTFNK